MVIKKIEGFEFEIPKGSKVIGLFLDNGDEFQLCIKRSALIEDGVNKSN